MLLLQFAKRSDANEAHSFLQREQQYSRIHWANVSLGLNTLPFFYTGDARAQYRVDGVKQLLVNELKFLDETNLGLYIQNGRALAEEEKRFRLSPEDVFIPFDNNKFQDYGFVMFPHTELTQDTQVPIFFS